MIFTNAIPGDSRELHFLPWEDIPVKGYALVEAKE